MYRGGNSAHGLPRQLMMLIDEGQQLNAHWFERVCDMQSDDSRNTEDGNPPTSEKRHHFRVEDVLPVILKRAEGDCSSMKPRILSGFHATGEASKGFEDVPDDSIHPRVWKMLLDIDTKLNLLLDQLYLDREGMTTADRQAVSLSASGIKLKTPDRYEVGDCVEIRMHLATHFSFWVIVYGQITRVEQVSANAFNVAVRFNEMDEEIRDKIYQHTLRRQREIIRTRGFPQE